MKILKFIPYIFLWSCSGENGTSSETQSSDTLSTDSVAVEEMESLPELDPNTTYSGNILESTQYHADEVMENVEELEWWAIQREPSGRIFIDTIEISGKRVHDGILDGEDEKTGWEIAPAKKSENEIILFINNLDFLITKDIEAFEIEGDIVKVGEPKKISYKGIDYTFKAKGNHHEDDYMPYTKDYELIINYNKDGLEKQQSLINIAHFDESTPQFMFIGDIDGDDMLDFIINNTWHYNVTLPTLYLSRPAEQDSVLKKVAYHQSVGC